MALIARVVDSEWIAEQIDLVAESLGAELRGEFIVGFAPGKPKFRRLYGYTIEDPFCVQAFGGLYNPRDVDSYRIYVHGHVPMIESDWDNRVVPRDTALLLIRIITYQFVYWLFPKEIRKFLVAPMEDNASWPS